VPLGRVQADLIAEVFNVFNRANYTLRAEESAANYNRPTEAQYRTAQIGFRITY